MACRVSVSSIGIGVQLLNESRPTGESPFFAKDSLRLKGNQDMGCTTQVSHSGGGGAVSGYRIDDPGSSDMREVVGRNGQEHRAFPCRRIDKRIVKGIIATRLAGPGVAASVVVALISREVYEMRWLKAPLLRCAGLGWFAIACAGCAGGNPIVDSISGFGASGRLKTYAQVEDKTMTDAFYRLSADGRTEALSPALARTPFTLSKLSTSAIVITKSMSNYANMGFAISSMESLVYEGESNEVARVYISTSKARGNVVRLYKPTMGKIINSLFKHPFSPGPQTHQWYDKDNPLIEFDSSGRIVSFLSRARHAFTAIGVGVLQFTTVYMGSSNARHLENNAKNSDFHEYLIREL